MVCFDVYIKVLSTVLKESVEMLVLLQGGKIFNVISTFPAG